jgi:dTDP-4-dehydrorhamnose reductase
MNIIVTGACGAVGSALLPLLRQSFVNITPIDRRKCSADTIELELTDVTGTRSTFESCHPDVIVHLAGTKDVCLCERDKDLSSLLNYRMTADLCDVLRTVPAKLIFISSDYVFDGESGPFSVESIPCPTTQYGRDKLRAERYIEDNVRNYAIVRTSAIFGHKNDFVDTVLRSVATRKSFQAYDNLFNNPTFVDDLGNMLRIIIEKDICGVLHCTGRETISRFEFAIMVAECFGCGEGVIECSSLDLSKDIRPRRLEMCSDKCYDILGYHPESIKATLQQNRIRWRDGPVVK